MADFGAPVAQNVNVSPAQGLQTISGLLGIQQQQQQLQTQTAQAQQAQQENQEKQALAQFTRMAVQDPKFRNSDGSLNVQKFQNGAQAAAPVYGQAYIGQATQNANSMIANREALLSLSNQQRATSGNYFAAVAANPNATRDDFLDAAEQARSVSDDPAYQRSIDRMLMSAPDVRALPTSQASQAIRQWARGIALETAAPGAAESAPQTGTIQGPGGIQVVNTNPQNPGGVGPRGAPIRNAAPPVQVASTYPGVQPTTQDIENFGAYNANLNNRVAIASDSIPRIQQAEAALDQIRGGAGAAGYAKLARVLQAVPGMPQSIVDAVGNGNLGAAQEAEKYLFQTTFSGLRQSMQGDPARVAEFEAADKIFPSIGSDPRAAKSVLNFMTQQGQRDYAEQQALTAARKNGTFNPVTWQADYQAQLRAGKVPGVPASQIPGAAAEGATQKSKSGRPMVFRNGRWEYQ